MTVTRTRPQRAAGNASVCARFISMAFRRLFRRTEMRNNGGRETERFLKETGLGPSRFSGPSLNDKWHQELVALAREQSGRN